LRWKGLQLAGALVAGGTVLAAWLLPPPAAQLAVVPAPALVAGPVSRAPSASTPAPAPRADGTRPRVKHHARPHASAEKVERVLARRMPGLEASERGRIARAILDEARGAAVDPLFVLALIAVESGFDHGAESVRGARGLMQLRRSTLESEAERSRLEGDLEDPVVNVRAGIRYYARLLRAFGDHDLALMAYNAGPNRILKYLREEGEIPERFHGYPQKVQAELHRLRGGAAAPPPAAGAAAVPDAPAAPAR
jgi:soluble lytic murein transglycosylase-like protein